MNRWKSIQNFTYIGLAPIELPDCFFVHCLESSCTPGKMLITNEYNMLAGVLLGTAAADVETIKKRHSRLDLESIATTQMDSCFRRNDRTLGQFWIFFYILNYQRSISPKKAILF